MLLIERHKVVRGPISTQLLGMMLTALIFVESNISLLTSGIVTQTLGSRHRVAREQLAYVIRNTGLTVWSSVLINGWGAAMMAVIATQVQAGVIGGNPFWILAFLIGIVAAMATRSDLMDHVNSQLPYEFAAGLVSLVVFVVLGMVV